MDKKTFFIQAKKILEALIIAKRNKNSKEVVMQHTALDKLLHGFVGQAGKTKTEKEKGV